MPRRLAEPTRRVHLHLPERDIERLAEYFDHTCGVASAVRAIIRNALDKIEQRKHDLVDAETIDVELPQELSQ